MPEAGSLETEGIAAMEGAAEGEISTATTEAEREAAASAKRAQAAADAVRADPPPKYDGAKFPGEPTPQYTPTVEPPAYEPPALKTGEVGGFADKTRGENLMKKGPMDDVLGEMKAKHGIGNPNHPANTTSIIEGDEGDGIRLPSYEETVSNPSEGHFGSKGIEHPSHPAHDPRGPPPPFKSTREPLPEIPKPKRTYESFPAPKGAPPPYKAPALQNDAILDADAMTAAVDAGPAGATAKALDDGIPSHVRPMLNIGDGTATTDASTAATRDIGGLQDSLNKPQRNFLDRIRTLKGSAKEAVRKQGANLEKALAQKTGVPLEDIQALTKAMDPAGRTLGEGRFPYMIRQLGQKSTRQTAVKLGAASSLTFAQTAQVQAEKESAEAGMKEATKGTKNAVDALNEAMGADFDALGKARGSADAKSQAERERQLRMLEAMARSQNTGGLAAAYQQHRNRAYY